MSSKTYPEFEPAWVEDLDSPGTWALRWLDETGKPAELIGVDRECDVPGMHTPGAALKILSMPLDKQAARLWTAIPVQPTDA